MNPCLLLRKWVQSAVAANIPKANTMGLSTVSEGGKPSSRMIVINEVTERGVIFFTDSRSPKIHDATGNTNVCALIYWPTLAKQVRLEGIVQPIDDALADAEFISKPFEYQLAITLCSQSARLSKYWRLKRQYLEALGRSGTRPRITRPPYWKGYELQANAIEFFQGADCRINRRLSFSKANGHKWHCTPLFP